jgi:hypothetical protein
VPSLAARLAEQHRQQQNRIAAAVAKAVRDAMLQRLSIADLDGTFPAYAVDAVRAITLGRVASARASAAYYAAARADAGFTDSFDVQQVVGMPLEQLLASLQVTGPVVVKSAIARGEAPVRAMASAQAATLGAAKRHTLNAGRDTQFATAATDHRARRWARVTDGDPCAFCAMLASRGAVYLTTETAGKGQHWHDRCGCQPVMVFEGQTDWPGRAMSEQLQDLWDSTPGGLSQFRAAYEQAYPVGSGPAQ